MLVGGPNVANFFNDVVCELITHRMCNLRDMNMI